VSEVGHDVPRRFAEASRSLLRATILEAADRLLAEHDWGAVTMAQVATAAGVSRQTVYNEFGNRAELARAYAIWSAQGLLDDVERSVAEHRHDLLDALVSTFSTLLSIGHRHPLIRALGDGDGSGELAAALVSGPGAADRRSLLVVVASDRLAEIIARTWDDLPTPTVVAVSEVLVRLAVSHLLLPSSTPEDAAAQVADVLGPLLASLRSG
jgi:AcrR family transcriptional regulator